MKKVLLCVTSLVLATLSALSFGACSPAKTGKVNVRYYPEIADVRAALISGTERVGVMAEPAATMLEKQTPDTTWYRLDVQELYDDEVKGYPQAVLMVKSSLLMAYPEIVTDIEQKINQNVDWAKQNPQIAVDAIKTSFPGTTLKAPMLSSKSIDNSKIYFQSASAAKSSVIKYVNEIRDIDTAGANQVGDDFFYTPSTANGDWTKQTISFYAPDGAPAISIAKFISDGENFGTGKKVNYNVVAAENVVGFMAQSNADIILLPVNGATKMYKANNNANDPYKLVSVITHGNLYIMSKTEITLDDLKLKEDAPENERLILAVPKPGAVPDWSTRIALSKHNLQVNRVD